MTHTIPLLLHMLTNSSQNWNGKSLFTRVEKFTHVQYDTLPPLTIFYKIKIIKVNQTKITFMNNKSHSQYTGRQPLILEKHPD